MRGTIRYAENGDPICEMCGKSFRRVLSHVVVIHKITSKEYRTRFGLNRTQVIANPAHLEHMRQLGLSDPLLTQRNLFRMAKRAEPGNKLRKGKKLRTQGKTALLERNEFMTEVLREAGKKSSRKGIKNRKKRGVKPKPKDE